MSFTVRANPVLHEFGEQEGSLAFVRFTADAASGQHQEWKVTAAGLDSHLHALESSGMRYTVLSQLSSGARVELPGTYSQQQIAAMGFGLTN